MNGNDTRRIGESGCPLCQGGKGPTCPDCARGLIENSGKWAEDAKDEAEQVGQWGKGW